MRAEDENSLPAVTPSSTLDSGWRLVAAFAAALKCVAGLFWMDLQHSLEIESHAAGGTEVRSLPPVATLYEGKEAEDVQALPGRKTSELCRCVTTLQNGCGRRNMSHTFWIQDDMITVSAVHMLNCGHVLVLYFTTARRQPLTTRH